jgi:phenylalanyl-tRNA synthetase beta chain
MKISYNWLQQFVQPTCSPEELSAALTDCGLEVEQMSKWQSVMGGLQGLCVGKVLTCVQHPNADRLHITTVDVGDGVAKQIVCGAPNVAAGQTVIVALPGTILYPAGGESFEIKKSKIRGESSEGMICAEDEIGLGTSHAGIHDFT